MARLLSEKEIIQALLFSPHPKSSEKLRLYLEYLRLKASLRKDGAEGGSGSDNEEIGVEPPAETTGDGGSKGPGLAVSPVASSLSSFLAAAAATGDETDCEAEVNVVPEASPLKRRRGRPPVLSRRVTVSCAPGAKNTIRALPAMLDEASRSRKDATRKRGRGRPRKNPLKQDGAAAAAPNNAVVEGIHENLHSSSSSSNNDENDDNDDDDRLKRLATSAIELETEYESLN